MRKLWLLTGVGLIMAVLALAAIGCSDDDGGNGGDATATEVMVDTPVPTEVSGTPAAASVEIVAPADGSTVSSPVTLEVSASGVEISPAGDAVEGAAHFHAFVDQEPVAEGEAVPQDTEGIFHFATGTLDLELEPGEHTVTVVLGDNTHVRLADAAPAVVTFTVE